MTKTIVTVTGMPYGKTPNGLIKHFKGMSIDNEVVPTLIVCDQHGHETGCKRENYRTLVNARVVSVSEGNEYVLEADSVENLP